MHTTQIITNYMVKAKCYSRCCFIHDDFPKKNLQKHKQRRILKLELMICVEKPPII